MIRSFADLPMFNNSIEITERLMKAGLITKLSGWKDTVQKKTMEAGK
jgi:hypothetical protein